jgi:hypothetical protein
MLITLLWLLTSSCPLKLVHVIVSIPTENLSSYDRSFVYNSTSVDDAVASLNAIVQDAMEQTIPRGFITKSKFPHWSSSALRYYIWRKNITITDVLK